MKKLYNSRSKKPYRISRTRIENFVKCPRCFYLEEKLGIKKPKTIPLTLNLAVDALLKKEFDIHRAKGVAHPLMKAYGLKAVPMKHEQIEAWQDSKHRGIRFLHPKTNFLIYGGIDDIWVNDKGELIIVDYKATSKKGEIDFENEEKHPYYRVYKNQLEIYQWLFRQNGFKVSDIGYFVFCNALKDKKAFDGKLEFKVELKSYNGDDSWVEGKILAAKKCLDNDNLPESADDCEYCEYRAAAKNAEK